MRKYLSSSRRAPFGATGFAVLYTQGQGEPLRSVQAEPVRSVMAPARRLRPVSRTASRTASRSKIAARRRLVLSVLFVALGVPFLVAVATGSAAAWWAVLALLPLVCTYLAVLFRSRRLTAEREINVGFFGGSERGEFGLDDMFPSEYGEAEELRAVGAGRY